jgi:hypothetical protein
VYRHVNLRVQTRKGAAVAAPTGAAEAAPACGEQVSGEQALAETLLLVREVFGAIGEEMERDLEGLPERQQQQQRCAVAPAQAAARARRPASCAGRLPCGGVGPAARGPLADVQVPRRGLGARSEPRGWGLRRTAAGCAGRPRRAALCRQREEQEVERRRKEQEREVLMRQWEAKGP